MHDNFDIFFIRHAQSQLNIASHNYRSKHNIPYLWKILCQHKQFLSGVRYNPDFIDCSITEEGRKQCMHARETANNLTPDVILVSPLERTLETCSLIFENRDIPIIVQPILAEVLRASCDISLQLQGKIKRFPKYNFDNVVKEGDLWFLKNQSEENQKKYNQALESQILSTHQQKCRSILKTMCPTFVYERPQSVRSRTWRVKQVLKRYKQKYNKIAVVSHYNIINFTVAKQFDEHHEPLNSADVKNCQIYPAKLQQLLKIK